MGTSYRRQLGGGTHCRDKVKDSHLSVFPGLTLCLSPAWFDWLWVCRISNGKVKVAWSTEPTSSHPTPGRQQVTFAPLPILP
jgi:hypothetical protein